MMIQMTKGVKFSRFFILYSLSLALLSIIDQEFEDASSRGCICICFQPQKLTFFQTSKNTFTLNPKTSPLPTPPPPPPPPPPRPPLQHLPPPSSLAVIAGLLILVIVCVELGVHDNHGVESASLERDDVS
jgi:hypothetical protein